MNKGTAIVGLLPLLFGRDGPHVGHRSQQGRRDRPRERSRSWLARSQRSAHSGHRQGPAVGQRRRAGHDRDLQRLPVPILHPRRADAEADQGHLRSAEGPPRLEEPARCPSTTTPSPQRKRLRPSSPWAATTRSGSSTTRRSPTSRVCPTRTTRSGRRHAGVDVAKFKACVQGPQVRGKGRRGLGPRHQGRRHGHPGVPHQRRDRGRRAAVREVQGSHRRAARRGPEADRVGHGQGQGLRRAHQEERPGLARGSRGPQARGRRSRRSRRPRTPPSGRSRWPKTTRSAAPRTRWSRW